MDKYDGYLQICSSKMNIAFMILQIFNSFMYSCSDASVNTV